MKVLKKSMELQEGKEKFIQTWGKLGSSWGINKTMAQVHALLLVSTDPLSANDIMQELNISRGNVNMSVRALIDWGLLHKVNVEGERREFFAAEKDMWEITRKIIEMRKKKELQPALQVLNELSMVEGNTEEVKEFKRIVQDFKVYSLKADATLDSLIKADQNWMVGTFMNMIK